ncbi:MAG: PTS glucitol/sorbitol transporter subunit IIA [Selenomonadaceae bacterium]|nr:PTS glucitol/sorbitol transporter subunit IIA [Selenomonadaceae bacterium]MBR6711912.1 PTS glucitol/sorbitol transporter subunit IIA [Selenomonadaceae bacterium]
MVKYEVKMTSIGKDAPAYLTSNSAFILMNEKIRPTLTDMVVEHTVGELAADIAVGDKLKVGKSEFDVAFVGNAVNQNLREEGHCTIVVNGEATMPGQIAVKGVRPPRLRFGNVIQFYTEE